MPSLLVVIVNTDQGKISAIPFVVGDRFESHVESNGIFFFLQFSLKVS